MFKIISYIMIFVKNNHLIDLFHLYADTETEDLPSKTPEPVFLRPVFILYKSFFCPFALHTLILVIEDTCTLCKLFI